MQNTLKKYGFKRIQNRFVNGNLEAIFINNIICLQIFSKRRQKLYFSENFSNKELLEKFLRERINIFLEK